MKANLIFYILFLTLFSQLSFAGGPDGCSSYNNYFQTQYRMSEDEVVNHFRTIAADRVPPCEGGCSFYTEALLRMNQEGFGAETWDITDEIKGYPSTKGGGGRTAQEIIDSLNGQYRLKVNDFVIEKGDITAAPTSGLKERFSSIFFDVQKVRIKAIARASGGKFNAIKLRNKLFINNSLYTNMA